ncbi:glycine cleavage system aminomethyltransferase GcvT [Thermoplasma sp. Kam2015]|uniref:glycine cleavage system aminomethyltransferase GcvT n=1 Tax=Thermoplasma sp. Kam2015 TaxID=2094122 RepID=UPI000D93294E|nr:glycine cleavage system aminomethyltransferase GcvT [Thermoplasma sp. Kam2015]PYB67544.1 glycine cleavage system aminomethyltransferase GcvT [Thermoplasma sp. Kam2015]
MRTVLYDEHARLNAKFTEFNGWDMPLYYRSIIDEHMAVRKHVGIFDVSHMGDITVIGKDASRFLDHMFPTQVSKLQNGECVYTAFLNDDGLMIDDTIVYRMGQDSFFFVPNAGTTDKIYRWVMDHSKGYDVKINNVSNKISSIALQGPQSDDVLAEIGYSYPGYFKFQYADGKYENAITGKDQIIISGTGYTGEKGVEFIIPNEYAVDLWKMLMASISKRGGLPAGLGARDTLRMEKGMLLSGHDFNEDRDPYEASISFIVNNENDFIGKSALEKRKSTDHEIFRGFILSDGIPRPGNPIKIDGKKIGIVTSGTISPVLNKGIALGYIEKAYSKENTQVMIEIRSTDHTATVTRPRIVK